MKYLVIVPAFTRVEERHVIEANSPEEAKDKALVGEPLETIEDADYYEIDKQDVRVSLYGGE